MEHISNLAIIAAVVLLIMSNLRRNLPSAAVKQRLEKMDALINQMNQIKQDAEASRIWRNIEDERLSLEGRLHYLWGLSEIKKSLDRMNEEGTEGWRGEDEEEGEIAWVKVYCHREIRKIGLRLRELDTQANKNASPDA